MKHKPALERHLFVSDFQIPEQDDKALNAVLSFIPDFKPDVIHFVGDILDLTKLSKYDTDVYDKHTFQDEIVTARGILKQFRQKAGEAKAFFYEGNHERRSMRYLSRKAPELADLADEEGIILSMPSLLKLRELGIQWVPFYKEHFIHDRILVEHGDICRTHAGYTAKAMLERRGFSGFSGHTHRLALHMITQSGVTKFWVETGSLCKWKFTYPYIKSGNWQQGLALGFYDLEERVMHPKVIPMFGQSFVYEGKIYRG